MALQYKRVLLKLSGEALTLIGNCLNLPFRT